MAEALLALKDLVQAKTRLAGLLRPSERRALVQAMLEDVLQVLASHPELEKITLVSDDPVVPLLAARYDLQHWSEAALGCQGLNAVMRAASERLLNASAERLVLLHADLPLLTSADISAALAAQRSSAGLVIGCDRWGSGTNLLAFDRAAMPRFCFGPDSCARHLGAARELGVPALVVKRPGIALDVDEPQDLGALIAGLPGEAGKHTADLLCGTALGTRIRVALGSLQLRREDNMDKTGDKGGAN
jgi:2-phospho-L-lactate guanylyltransferase